MDRHLIVLIGNIASGKSTLAKKFSKKGYRIVSSDAIRYMFRPDEYRFNPEDEYAVAMTMLSSIKYLMELGFSVVVDNAGNSFKNLREMVIAGAMAEGYKIVAVEMPKTSKMVAVARRMKDPHGKYSKEVWNAVYDKFGMNYVKPTKKEGFNVVCSSDSVYVRNLLKKHLV